MTSPELKRLRKWFDSCPSICITEGETKTIHLMSKNQDREFQIFYVSVDHITDRDY